MDRVGITTTIPAEIIFAANKTVVDLNNLFITGLGSSGYIEEAEVDGFPRTTCGWIKGMYSACLDHGIQTVVAVTQGDCSNTHSLMEILKSKGVETAPFDYPLSRDIKMMKASLLRLANFFEINIDKAEHWREKLNIAREKLWRIDKMTWKDGVVSGFENHLLQVSASDFESDPDAFEKKLDSFIEEASLRKPIHFPVRLGMIGVPTIIEGLYEFAEQHQARFLFNETQRQFTMPNGGSNLAEQYLRYTYPYDICPRITDINEQVKLRQLDGIVHYVQSFCHMQMEDLLFRERLDMPILTIEGDTPGPIDARTKIRMESFIQMIQQQKAALV
ncbi:MAG TPA: 2-hydroxyacyl-CoA dehydratase [Nitrospinota bacterium]|nr:2-hydroxyacyl-CoA dehydratase [Nitrospinota bacterium]|tara:strand:+ start:52332 stop:53327 length:996 start_codon:yes stop_codon:yes gene_type:complete